MKPRCLAFIVVMWAFTVSAAVTLTPASARAMLSELPLHDVEGIWQLTVDGASVVIVRSASAPGTPGAVTAYDMLMLESPDRAILPGTKIGELTPLGRPRSYDGHIYTVHNGLIRRDKTQRVTVRLEDDSHLTFRNISSGVQITPYLVIPWTLRRGIRIGSDREAGLDGCIKIYPELPTEGAPRYM